MGISLIDLPKATDYEEVLVTAGNSVEIKSKGNWSKPCEWSELDLTHPAKAKYSELQYYAREKGGESQVRCLKTI